MREHIEFATDSLLPEQEAEINGRLRTEGVVKCHRCQGKGLYQSVKKLKEHFKIDCPFGPGQLKSIYFFFLTFVGCFFSDDNL